MQPTFSISEALSYGWKKTIENVWLLGAISLAFMTISFGFDQVNEGVLTIILFKIFNVLLTYFVTYTFVRLALKIHRGEKPTIKDVFEVNWHLFVLYLIAILASSILGTIGFMLLVIPGIYIMIRLSLFHFALVEEKLRPLAALKRSMELTRYSFWSVLLLSLVLTLINVAGVIVFGLGLLITMPMSVIVLSFVYHKLKPAPRVEEKAAAPEPAPVA